MSTNMDACQKRCGFKCSSETPAHKADSLTLVVMGYMPTEAESSSVLFLFLSDQLAAWEVCLVSCAVLGFIRINRRPVDQYGIGTECVKCHTLISSVSFRQSSSFHFLDRFLHNVPRDI